MTKRNSKKAHPIYPKKGPQKTLKIPLNRPSSGRYKNKHFQIIPNSQKKKKIPQKIDQNPIKSSAKYLQKYLPTFYKNIQKGCRKNFQNLKN